MKFRKVLTTLCIASLIITLACSSQTAQTNTGEKTSPGTVNLNALLSKIVVEKSQTVAELKIVKINSYGQSSRPIAANSTLSAAVLLSSVKNDLEKFSVGDTINVVIKIMQGGINTKDLTQWELVQIIIHNK